MNIHGIKKKLSRINKRLNQLEKNKLNNRKVLYHISCLKYAKVKLKNELTKKYKARREKDGRL